jgi:hypothetical protein
MRRVITELALAIAALGVVAPAYAAGSVECEQTGLITGQCTISATQPGSGTRVTPVSNTPDGDTSSGLCIYNGGPIPCTKDGGWWSNEYGCYVQGPLAALPAPGVGGTTTVVADPGMAYYLCTRPGDVVSGVIQLPLTAGGPPLRVDPAVVARTAVEQMNLRAGTIGIAPEPGTGRTGAVGLPVWLWIAEPDAQTWGPVTETATVGATTVTATAEVTETVWDLGDGTTVVCTTPGTPYRDSFGLSASPDCGHRYVRSSANSPGGAYTVTATSTWAVTWVDNGTSTAGTIRLSLTAATALRIGEVQVLNG